MILMIPPRRGVQHLLDRTVTRVEYTEKVREQYFSRTDEELNDIVVKYRNNRNRNFFYRALDSVFPTPETEKRGIDYRLAQMILQERVIERYKDHPLVASALKYLTYGSRFEAGTIYKLKSFYDIGSDWRLVPKAAATPTTIYEVLHLEEEDPQKRGSYPQDLVDILQSFTEKPFDTARLQYESVREDYQRWTSPSRSSNRQMITASALVGIMGGISGMYVLEGNALIYPLTVGLSGAAALVWSTLFHAYWPKPKGSKGAIEEVRKLRKASRKADSFVMKHYNK